MADLPAVPDYFGQFMAPLQRQQQIDINRVQANAEAAQVQERAMELAAKIHQQRAFQQDAQSVISNPTPDGYRSLLLKYPDQYQGIKAAWDNQAEGQRTRDTEAASQVYAALANGRNDIALSLLKDRKTAMTNAGEDDKLTDGIIEMIESGDPAKIKQAQGIAGYVLATSAGPDKIGSTLEALSGSKGGFTLDPGAIRYDDNGNVVAESPYLQGKDGTLYQKDGSGAPAQSGGAPAPSAAPAGGGGFDYSVSRVLGHEGGYNPKDLNGSPTMRGINWKANAADLTKMGLTPATFKNMTEDQAKELYKGYWDKSGADNLPANLQAPFFDVYIRNPKFAKAALVKSGGDPVKFMDLADNYFGSLAKKSPDAAKYAKAWANRDADNRAIATGGAPGGAAPAPSNAPAGYHVLIPAGQGAPPSGYEPDPARPGALRPIPGGPADKPGNAPPDPQEIHDAATQYLLTDQMPPLGMGGAGFKQAIIAERSKIMQNLGITAEQLPVFRAQYDADKKALKDNVSLLSNLQSSENALKANAQQVWNTHRTLVADGIISNNPWITRKKLSYYANFGSPDEKAHVKQYLDAVNAYSTEYSKFMTAANGMGGSAAPSDAARSQAGELNDPGLAATPLLAHLRQGLTEAINKRNGVAQQTEALQHKLTHYLEPHRSASAAAPSGVVRITGSGADALRQYNALKPGQQYIDPNGVHRTKR